MLTALKALAIVGLLTPLSAHASEELSDRTAATANGSTNYRGVPVTGTPFTEVDLTRAQFDTKHSTHTGLGRELVDVEIVYRNSAERYSATWARVPGEVHVLIQGTSSQWSSFLTTINGLSGRFLDVEVGYFGGSKRWSGLFYENGDFYSLAMRTTNTDSQFQAWAKQYFDEGRSIIDFEAYEQPGSGMRFAGAWVSDPNQPRTVLYYDLLTNQVTDLLGLKAGRVIDYERYFHVGHNQIRYALILEMTSGGEQIADRFMTTAEVATQNTAFGDSDTFLIDIEPFEDGASPLFAGIWGDNFKSLSEIASTPSDTSIVGGGAAASTAAIFESNGGGSRIGVWARNVRTGQTLAWRAGEPFYLASTAKIAIHLRLWKAFQDFAMTNGGLNPLAAASYTTCSDCRSNWYVDERTAPGLNSSNFGSSFTLTRYDQGMMNRSDNAAASLLVDHATLGLDNQPNPLNEWLAAIPGVGQGFFPVTSIHTVDRTILWQSQVEAFPNDSSFYNLPAWSWEPYTRRSGTAASRDIFCDLATVLGIVCGSSGYPSYNYTEGSQRYYNMGLNSATPRALGRLLLSLVQGDLLNPTFTQDAIDTMGSGTPLDNQWTPAMNQSTVINAKGGIKGGASHPVSDAAVVTLGPDTIIMTVLTKDNQAWGSGTSGVNNVRSFTSQIGFDLLEQLGANLTEEGTSSFSPSSVGSGQTFTIQFTVRNEGGGNAHPFDIEFRASENTNITSIDDLIHSVRINGLAGGTSQVVTVNVPFPAAIGLDNYNLGWIIDRTNEVGEWDETGADNVGIIGQFEVVGVTSQIFADGFESGSTTAWSN